jgi:hypothetical protein
MIRVVSSWPLISKGGMRGGPSSDAPPVAHLTPNRTCQKHIRAGGVQSFLNHLTTNEDARALRNNPGRQSMV